MKQMNNASALNGGKDNLLSQVRKKVFAEKVAFSVKTVFDSLIKLTNDYESCIASAGELREISGYSVRTVKRALKTLTEFNYIKVKYRFDKYGKNLPNCYIFIDS